MENNTIPLWVKRIEHQGGRDHLGLESVGQNMLEEISCGISNITERLRYFSLFCWVLYKFLNSRLKKTKSNYRILINKITFLYALSNSLSHLEEANTGINGIEFIRKNFKDILNHKLKLDNSLFKSNAPINNDWIYRGKLNDLKLILLQANSGIPKIVKPNGLKLAETFDKLNLNLNFENLNLNQYTNVDTLKNLEEKWCYHNLSKNDEERQLLEDIIFSKSYNKYSMDNYKELNRRYTLTLLMKYIDQKHLKNRQDFEKWIYFNKEKQNQNISHTLLLWKILFARNYLVFSLESLFFYFLEKINIEPLSYSEFIEIIKNIDTENNIINKFFKNNNFKNIFEMKIDKLFEKLYSPDISLDKNNILSETNLILDLETNLRRNLDSQTVNLYLVYPIFCLYSLYFRWSKKELNIGSLSFMKMGGSKRFSLYYLFQYLQDYKDREFTVGDMITDLYHNFILPQHFNVSFEKLYDRNINTFHFSIDSNKYYTLLRNQQFYPNYNFMKINEIFNFFQDLELVSSEDNSYYNLTQRGKNLLIKYYG